MGLKVLHYIDENRLAWGETWIRLIKEIGHQGGANHVVCKSGGTLAGRLCDEGLSFDVCDVPVACLPWTAQKFGRIIDGFKPDVIHTRLSSAARIGGWWGKHRGIPVVQTVDKYPKAYYHKDATFLIACSESVKEHMLSLGFNQKILIVVYNPIDVCLYKRNEEVRRMLRNKYCISDEQTVILAAGRFVGWKGFDILLRAYAACYEQDESFFAKTKLFLLGDGEERDNLLTLVKSLKLDDRLIMPGFVKDIRPYLWASDLFVLPSKQPEPFGIVLLEAMAAGLAPIATQAGGPLDIITDNKSGWFVPSGDSDALAAKLLEVVHPGNVSVVSGNAIQRTQCFNVSTIASETIAIYKHVLLSAL